MPSQSLSDARGTKMRNAHLVHRREARAPGKDRCNHPLNPQSALTPCRAVVHHYYGDRVLKQGLQPQPAGRTRDRVGYRTTLTRPARLSRALPARSMQGPARSTHWCRRCVDLLQDGTCAPGLAICAVSGYRQPAPRTGLSLCSIKILIR